MRSKWSYLISASACVRQWCTLESFACFRVLADNPKLGIWILHHCLPLAAENEMGRSLIIVIHSGIPWSSTKCHLWFQTPSGHTLLLLNRSATQDAWALAKFPISCKARLYLRHYISLWYMIAMKSTIWISPWVSFHCARAATEGFSLWFC